MGFTTNIVVSSGFSQAEKNYLESLSTIDIFYTQSIMNVAYINDKKEVAGIYNQFFNQIKEQINEQLSADNQIKFNYNTRNLEKGGEPKVEYSANPTLLGPIIKGQVYQAGEYGAKFSDTLGTSLELFVVQEGGKVINKSDNFSLSVSSKYALDSTLIQKEYPNATFIYAKSVEESLENVTQGLADACLVPQLAFSYWAQKPVYSSLSALYAYSMTYDVSIGVVNDTDDLLLSIINKCVNQISSDEFSNILALESSTVYTDSFSDFWYKSSGLYITIILSFVLFIVICGVAVIIVSRFNNRIKMRNSELIMATNAKNIAEEARQKLVSEQEANAKYQQKIWEAANKDELTGLYNKRCFLINLEDIIKNQKSSDPYYIMICDATNFKSFNDLFGRNNGDELIKSIADVYRAELKRNIVICGRLEAERFAFVIKKNASSIDKIYQRISDSITEISPNFKFIVTLGVYLIENSATSAAEALDKANLALKRAKNLDNASIHYAVYSETMKEEIVNSQIIINEFDQALQEGQIRPYIQPIYNQEGKFSFGEALVRWVKPDGNVIPPNEFVPVIEKNGLITKLDINMWKQIAKTISQIIREKGIDHITPISVNCSRNDICNANFVKYIEGLIKEYNIPAGYLNFEITETVFVENIALLSGKVKELQKLGCLVEMDDFGSGYSSLNILKDIPVNVVKLDMTFVHESIDKERGRTIIRNTLDMCRELGIFVVAEGVETEEQFLFLKQAGCQYMQGYLFSSPISVKNYLELYERNIEKNNVAKMINNNNNISVTKQNSIVFSDIFSDVFYNYLGACAIIEYRPNKSFKFVKINDLFAKLTVPYYDKEAILKINFYDVDISPTDDKLSFFKQLNDSILTHQIVNHQRAYFNPKSNANFIFDESYKLIEEIDGNYLFFMRIDRNDVVTSLDELKAKKAFSNILENLPSGLVHFLFNKDTETAQLDYINQSLLVELDYTLEELKDRTKDDFFNLLPDEDAQELKKTIARLIIDNDGNRKTMTYRLINKQGKELWYLTYGNVINHGNKSEVFVSLNNITKEKSKELMLENRIKHDQLTKVLSRDYFISLVDDALQKPHESNDYVLVIYDIDSFKGINDTFGHPFGDNVLIEVAKTTEAKVRNSICHGRIGGDEFAILIKVEKDIPSVLTQIDEWIKEEKMLSHFFNSSISISVGVYAVSSCERSFNDCFSFADKALYKAKEKRGTYSFLESSKKD